MLPDQVSNPGPLTYESDALPIALRGPALVHYGPDSETKIRQMALAISFPYGAYRSNQRVSDVGFTAHQHKKATSRRNCYNVHKVIK